MKIKYIYVFKTFLIKQVKVQDNWKEVIPEYLWDEFQTYIVNGYYPEHGESGVGGYYSSLNQLKDYLNKAGAPYPGEEHVYYDDPFECRWDHGVVEKMYPGPCSINKTLFWFKAKFVDGRVNGIEVLKRPPIWGTKNTFNYISFS